MISDRTTAEKFSRLVLDVSSILNESAALVAASDCPDHEKAQCYKVLGQLLGTIGIDVLNPIYRIHPGIKPPDYPLPEEL